MIYFRSIDFHMLMMCVYIYIYVNVFACVEHRVKLPLAAKGYAISNPEREWQWKQTFVWIYLEVLFCIAIHVLVFEVAQLIARHHGVDGGTLHMKPNTLSTKHCHYIQIFHRNQWKYPNNLGETEVIWEKLGMNMRSWENIWWFN